MSNTVHVVCLDAPAPPDYGGAIDMFYKVKALYEIGLNIILHYFDYNKARHVEGLEKFCSEIHMYQRKSFLQALPLSRPFIVHSRVNENLIKRLNADGLPVLLEGLHCSGVVPFLQNKKRVVVRMHNDEARYYQSLAQAEKSYLRRGYYLQESRLLHKYQQQLDKGISVACISETDVRRMQGKYRFQDVCFIPCFLPWQSIRSKEGKGDYCLYHGNLAVAENEAAVLWLVKNVFNHLPFPLVVAGNNASERLTKMTTKHKNVFLVNNPPIEELAALIDDAHINVLPSTNNTGVKLKLLNALLNGRFCITNHNGAAGSKIEKGLFVKNTAGEWTMCIEELMEKMFAAPEMKERETVLALYDNRSNAQKLSALWKRYQ